MHLDIMLYKRKLILTSQYVEQHTCNPKYTVINSHIPGIRMSRKVNIKMSFETCPIYRLHQLVSQSELK